MRKREGADLRRDKSAVSPQESVANVDRLMDDEEALLSCPHANRKFTSETQMPGIEISTLALEGPSAIARRAIAVPDFHPFLLLQPRKESELKNPSMRSPGGKAIAGEVIVGQANPIFQGGIVK